MKVLNKKKMSENSVAMIVCNEKEANNFLRADPLLKNSLVIMDQLEDGAVCVIEKQKFIDFLSEYGEIWAKE